MGGSGGTERGFGGASGGDRSSGASRQSAPPRPGSSCPAAPRARSAAVLGWCAPFQGSRTRHGSCGLHTAGRVAREPRASVSRRLSCPGERTARKSRAGRSRGGAPAAPQPAGGRLPRGQPEVRAAQEAAGLFSSFSYFLTQRSRNGECGVLWVDGGRGSMGPHQGGRLDGVVGAPSRKSANRPFFFAPSFSASASALEPLGKPLGRRGG